MTGSGAGEVDVVVSDQRDVVGHRSFLAMSACSRPRASRSLTARTRVGTIGRMTGSYGSAPPPPGPRRVSRGRETIEARRAERGDLGPLATVTDLGRSTTAADERDPPTADVGRGVARRPPRRSSTATEESYVVGDIPIHHDGGPLTSRIRQVARWATG